jgi:hypothetical protein
MTIFRCSRRPIVIHTALHYYTTPRGRQTLAYLEFLRTPYPRGCPCSRGPCAAHTAVRPRAGFTVVATAAISIYQVTQSEPQLGCGCKTLTTRSINGQDRQVHEREEGGRLVNDGYIHIGIKSSNHRVMATRPYNGNKTGRSA